MLDAHEPASGFLLLLLMLLMFAALGANSPAEIICNGVFVFACLLLTDVKTRSHGVAATATVVSNGLHTLYEGFTSPCTQTESILLHSLSYDVNVRPLCKMDFRCNTNHLLFVVK